MLLRKSESTDRSWIGEVLRTRWGSTEIAVRGQLLDGLALPAVIAEREGQRCGLATYECNGEECEIVSLDALEQYIGIGTALVDAVAEIGRQAGATVLVVETTNDNLDALRFYQRRGFAIRAIRPGAIERSRQLKQDIPATGSFGIPIRDEIDLTRPIPSEPRT